VHGLEKRGGKRALATMCVGVGQGVSLALGAGVILSSSAHADDPVGADVGRDYWMARLRGP